MLGMIMENSRDESMMADKCNINRAHESGESGDDQGLDDQ